MVEAAFPDSISANAGIPVVHDVVSLVAAQAGPYSIPSYVATPIKRRLLSDLVAQRLGALTGVCPNVEEARAELRGRSRREGAVPRKAIDRPRDLGRTGNKAVYNQNG